MELIRTVLISLFSLSDWHVSDFESAGACLTGARDAAAVSNHPCHDARGWSYPNRSTVSLRVGAGVEIAACLADHRQLIHLVVIGGEVEAHRIAVRLVSFLTMIRIL